MPMYVVTRGYLALMSVMALVAGAICFTGMISSLRAGDAHLVPRLIGAAFFFSGALYGRICLAYLDDDAFAAEFLKARLNPERLNRYGLILGASCLGVVAGGVQDWALTVMCSAGAVYFAHRAWIVFSGRAAQRR